MESFDYVVVGAGSAGSVLAARLSEDLGVSVVLLEAGGTDGGTAVSVPAAFPKLFGTARDWSYETEAQAGLGGRRLRWPRGRMLGGCSSMNAQMYVRGQRADYDSWSAQGATGWGFDDVLPWFERAERAQSIEHLRDPNPLTDAFVAAAQQVGIRAVDINGERVEGVSTSPVTQRHGRRWSAADAYLRPARSRRNLTVRTHVHVRRVLLEGRRAVGVQTLNADGSTRTIRATREVVLAAGALNSPQLLQLSGIGDPAHLAAAEVPLVHELPHVGHHLRDHLVSLVVRLTDVPVSLASAQRPVHLLRYLARRRGPLTSNVAEALALVRTDPTAPAPDIELIFAPVPFLDHGATPPPGHGYTVGVVLLKPASSGSVRITVPDARTAPAIDPGYLSDSDGTDLRVLTRGLQLAQRVLDADAFTPYAARPHRPDHAFQDDDGLADFVRSQAETLYHPVGTCRISPSAATGVVDSRLRVHGLDGLRVADASVMPDLIRGHTHAPTVMIAERAAAFLAEERTTGVGLTLAQSR